MNPEDIFVWLGQSAGDLIGGLASSAFEGAMKGIWIAALWLLRESFTVVDRFSTFTLSTEEGPVSVLWPMMLWLGGILALGLFFWQITVAVLRGGRGFVRVMSGPFQYGVAIAATVGLAAGFLAAADGVTTGILDYGLHVKTFSDSLNVMGLNDAASDSVKSVVVGLAGIFGLLPAALGFAIEMVFREAAVYLLGATIPVIAAGLLANVTSSWYWRGIRWILAAIMLKPALALVLVIGIAIVGEAQGISGLLAGIAVLWMAVWIPLVLYKLFAFVDPNTGAGAAVRDAFSDQGIDSYGSGSPAGKAYQAAKNKLFGGSDDDSSGADDSEQANTDRFDSSMDDDADPIADGDADDASGGSGGAKDNRGGAPGEEAAGGDSDSPPMPDPAHTAEEAADPAAGAQESSEASVPESAEGTAGVLPEAAAASTVEAAADDDSCGDDEEGDPEAGKVVE
ncbi:hypothetical protein [Amycolatopsis sp. lyj-112]|uniref:hypothetical protein n=1 Tax=Amycolatopsis sp. lyj-112 TaxID=2789288 RepID=UPI00397DA555